MRATLSSNVHQVCTSKSNKFLRDTAVTRISFFLEILMLYEVYSNKFDIRFTGKTTLFLRNYQIFNVRAARATLSSNAHHVCTPKSKNFLRDTAVTRISFFLEILMLYEVYMGLLNLLRNNFSKMPNSVQSY